jgi:hypothetical protein
MRMASRHGKGANIFQHPDIVRLQYGRKVSQVAR